MPNFIDLSGKYIGNWNVLERDYSKNNDKNKTVYFKCECTLCGTIHIVNAGTLRNGSSTCCKQCSLEKKREDLTNKTYGYWKVLNFAHSKNGHTYWNCECTKCGIIRPVDAGTLKNGSSTYCGQCDKEKRYRHKDLTGKKIGQWTVQHYVGTKNNYAVWHCKCSCGKEKDVLANSLLNGRSLSCGHTNLQAGDTYGELTLIKSAGLLGKNKDQPAWVCKCSCGKILNVFVGNLTSGQTTSCGHNIGFSKAEREVGEFIRSLGFDPILNDRKVLEGKELDIYLPDQHLAIEYDGLYWHSEEMGKDKNYHLYKTAACAKKGVDLIHIFEHEWVEPEKQEKIKELLKSKLNIGQKIVYARNLEVRYVTNKDILKDFLEKYHLQGYVESELTLGLFDNDELIQVMTFGLPRFNKNFDIELLRLCTKHGYKVTGGAAKLFEHFKKDNTGLKLITYCDLSKFTGRVYEGLNFKQLTIAMPNYIYVKTQEHGYEIKTRYQCQKHKLLKQGYGNLGNTEQEIMTALGYVKFYDCGNAVYVYEIN